MERWKLHGNISRNGYGNAIIGRYGGCFEEGIWLVYDTGERCAVLESKNIQVIKAKYYAHAPRGIDW